MKLVGIIKKLYNKILKMISENKAVVDDCILINTKRLFYASILALFLHAIQMIYFTLSFSNNTLWSNIIIYSNITMICFWITIFFIMRSVRKRTYQGSIIKAFHYFIVCTFFIYSIVITSVNQIITNCIVPYMIACMIVGAGFLMKPLVSLIIYVSVYIVFFFSISVFHIHSDSILILNRMNSLTATGLAYFISVIMWRYNRVNVVQKHRIQIQQKELKTVNKELEKIAFIDPLTGLLNRRSFDRIVNKELAMMERNDYESCLIMLDIDFFKHINDIYGHPAGDSVLIQISNLLKKSLRKYDALCRLGGEEFLILLPHTTLKDSKTVAEKLRKSIESYKFFVCDNKVNLTASFGVSSLASNSKAELIHKYANADNALYLAKQDGRNCVRASECTLG